MVKLNYYSSALLHFRTFRKLHLQRRMSVSLTNSSILIFKEQQTFETREICVKEWNKQKWNDHITWSLIVERTMTTTKFESTGHTG